MPTSFLFNNKQVLQPGAYSSVQSQVRTIPRSLPYGNILIIDTGSAAGWGAAGVNGQVLSGPNSVYEFSDLGDFRSFVRGGVWWTLAEHLFRPNGPSSVGVSKVYWISAKESTQAEIDLVFTAGANGGTITVKTLEGLGSNATISAGDNLTKGFAAKLTAGVVDPTKYVLTFYVGTYRGEHTDGSDLAGIDVENCVPQSLARSPEFSTVDELTDWMDRDFSFNQWFEKGAVVVTGTGALVAGDLTANPDYIGAAGGTETYGATDVDDALEAVTDLDYTFVFSDKVGADASGVVNSKILEHLVSEAKYIKFLWAAGGTTQLEFQSQSIAAATTLNTSRAHIIHGGIKIATKLHPSGFRSFPALNKAALLLGRLCGLEPQTPLAFKAVKFDGEQHIPTKGEVDLGLERGVLMTKWSPELGSYIAVQGINTLQVNTQLVNTDGQSHDIGIMRIISQLDRDLIFNAIVDVLGNQQQGPNVGVLTPQDIKQWTLSQLQRRVSRDNAPNLLLEVRDVTVELVQDAYQVNYGFIPNYPIHKLFFIGSILDPSTTTA